MTIDFKDFIVFFRDNLVAFIVTYYVLSQIFPQLRLWDKKGLNGYATKKDFELLFLRFDDLVNVVRQDRKEEVAKANMMVQKMIDMSADNSEVMQGLKGVIDNLKERIDLLDTRINDMIKILTEVNINVKHLQEKQRH